MRLFMRAHVCYNFIQTRSMIKISVYNQDDQAFSGACKTGWRGRPLSMGCHAWGKNEDQCHRGMRAEVAPRGSSLRYSPKATSSHCLENSYHHKTIALAR